MVNQQTLMGNWSEIVGKIRSRWGQLTDDDLTQARGNVDELMGTIQRKTGESREAVERFLDTLTAQGGSAVGSAAEQARQYAGQAGERIQEATRQVGDRLRSGYSQAEQLVQQRPAESMATAFGVGLITGLILGIVITSGSSR
jgi:uncharacterized protein YjbJ (UPF0337 family)